MFDAHLHLQDQRFDASRSDVIAAAVDAGVTGACCCSCSPEDWRSVSTLAEKIAEVSQQRSGIQFALLPAFGVHPWYAGNLPADWLTQLETFLTHHPAAPMGEIGIDGLRDEPPRAIQRQIFCAQLELAARLHRPVVLHGARAWGELLEILKPFAPRLPGFMLHAFGGSADILREAVHMGGYISFAGTVCNPAATRVRAAVLATPSERLLIETDAPDMLPWGAASSPASPRGAGSPALRILNQPANLVRVAQAVAALRGVSVEELAATTAQNGRTSILMNRVFGSALGVRQPPH